jgi:ribosomal protein S18 acetylase RimI-like enzyme
MLTIRWAGVADAPELAQLKRAVWPDDKPDPALIARVFSDTDRCTLVAHEDGVMAGFVDVFVTVSSEGVTRWEIDLLAVHPRRRGRGIGQMLTRAVCEEGAKRGIALARALTHIQNTGVHRTFGACGFATDHRVYGLYIASGILDGAVTALPTGLHLFPVATLNYCGLWLEGVVNAAGLIYAGRVRALYGWDLAGAVIPEDDTEATHAALRIGYEQVGLYYWWVKPLTISG